LSLSALFLLLNGCTIPVRTDRSVEKGIPVRFVYVDKEVKQVCLVGSFNDWAAGSQCLSRTGDKWILQVFLAPGRYQYAFMVDGKTWREDPGAVLSEESGFGTRNSVLIVE
jgi:1,4-alpha-glucan branching enzyme